MARLPPVDQRLLIIEDTLSHSDAPQSVGLLWTSYQPNAENLSDNTQQSQQTDIRDPGGIRTRNPSKPAAADPRLRPQLGPAPLKLHMYSNEVYGTAAINEHKIK
jgi:hypothetical protein